MSLFNRPPRISSGKSLTTFIVRELKECQGVDVLCGGPRCRSLEAKYSIYAVGREMGPFCRVCVDDWLSLVAEGSPATIKWLQAAVARGHLGGSTGDSNG